jgi:hypothetical protein
LILRLLNDEVPVVVVKRWLSTRRSFIMSAMSGAIIFAVVITIAMVSNGYASQQMNLGDASVWVSNSDRQVIGRANTQIRELNTVISQNTSEYDIVQDGSTVLILDSGNSAVDVVDAATSEIIESIALPPHNPRVLLSQSAVVIAADGDMWFMLRKDFPTFNTDSLPTLSLGSGTVAELAADGMLTAFSPQTDEVYRIDAHAGGNIVETIAVPQLAHATTVQVTSVGASWAVFDSEDRKIVVNGTALDLSATLNTREETRLQTPSVTGEQFLLAYEHGLVGIPVTALEPVPLVQDRSGKPAMPLRTPTCDYSAWADGFLWSSCGDRVSTVQLGGMPSPANLMFRTNEDRAVLNDTHGGRTWAIQANNELIDNWEELIDNNATEQHVIENTLDTPPEYETDQLPPVAVDDDLGARSGRSNVLPVLLNDYDPNGDVLVISEAVQPAGWVARVDLINNGQQLLLTLPKDVEGHTVGTIDIPYTVTDGKGGSATAVAHVTLRAETENSAPQQVRVHQGLVHEGGRYVTPVLGDWFDPDGDPFYLTAVHTVAPDDAGFTAEGQIVFTERGGQGEKRTLSLTT